jgi:hypothetical protein
MDRKAKEKKVAEKHQGVSSHKPTLENKSTPVIK